MLSRVAEANGAPALEGMNVLGLVQGELAQIPRMLNHARALSDAGATVALARYTQVRLPDDITRPAQLSVRRISEAGAERLDSVPRAFYLPAAASEATPTKMRPGPGV